MNLLHLIWKIHDHPLRLTRVEFTHSALSRAKMRYQITHRTRGRSPQWLTSSKSLCSARPVEIVLLPPNISGKITFMRSKGNAHAIVPALHQKNLGSEWSWINPGLQML